MTRRFPDRPAPATAGAPSPIAPWPSRYAAAAAPLLALACALVLWAAMDPEPLKALLGEEGPIERPTALLYFALAALIWWWRTPGDDGLDWLAFSVVLVAFGARELDLHRAWTGGSMLKLSFYLRDAPLLQKLVSAAVLTVVLAATFRLLRRHARSAWNGLRRGDTVPTTLALFFGTMVVTKVFDRSVNILAEDFGVVTPLAAGTLVAAVEEIVELSLPVMAAIGFLQHRRSLRA